MKERYIREMGVVVPEVELYLMAKYRLENLKSYYMPNEFGKVSTSFPFDEIDNSVIDLAISLIDEKIDGLKEVTGDDTERDGG